MAILLCLDDIIEDRGATVTELANAVGISRINMSNLKMGKVKAIRLSTLEGICNYLDCQPGDIIKFVRTEGTSYRTDGLNAIEQESD